MIKYLIYSEFDLKLGNVVKVEHPSKIPISSEVLASLMIPDGSHNNFKDQFFFAYNKSASYMTNISKQLAQISADLLENSTNYKDVSASKQ